MTTEELCALSFPVMRGLDPRIHDFLLDCEDVDHRDKPGDDKRQFVLARLGSRRQVGGSVW